MNELSLRTIESRSWKARQQDGLFDLYFGGLMLAISLSALVEAFGAAPVARLVVLMVLQLSAAGGFALAKRRYATPRMGAVKFGAGRAQRSRILGIALGVCVLVTAALVVLTALGQSPVDLFSQLGRYALPTVVTLVVGIPLTAVAVFLELGRILFHAALFTAATFALAASGHSFMAPIPGAIAFGISGSISVAVGAVIFTRFVRRIPRNRRQGPSDEG
jgi:hypothetical protein